MTKEGMVAEYWHQTIQELHKSEDCKNMDLGEIKDMANMLTRKEFNITQEQLESMYIMVKGEVAMTELSKEEVQVREERQMAIKEAKRRHKETLWNNKYYVLYKILTVVAITTILCVSMLIHK